MHNAYVAYYRVSTAQQGASGLGLAAQRALVAEFIDRRGGRLVAAYEEVVSGRTDCRAGLTAALRACEQAGAVLVIAKLDRLSRRVAYIARILDSRVSFVVADMPEADRMTLQMMAVVAEKERALISERTKAALQAAKGRGQALGNPALMQSKAAAAKARTDRADRFAREMYRVVAAVHQGTTYALAAEELNRLGLGTANGGRWHGMTVRNLILRGVRLQEADAARSFAHIRVTA